MEGCYCYTISINDGLKVYTYFALNNSLSGKLIFQEVWISLQDNSLRLTLVRSSDNSALTFKQNNVPFVLVRVRVITAFFVRSPKFVTPVGVERCQSKQDAVSDTQSEKTAPATSVAKGYCCKLTWGGRRRWTTQ